MRAIRIAAAVAAIALPSLSPAAAPAGSRDVRCLMLSTMFGKVAAAPQAKTSAGQTRIFYLGRVSSKFTPVQLEAAMTAEAKTIDSDHAGDEMDKCLATVQAAAAAVEIAGNKVAGVAGPKQPGQ